jgi:hypothetical protein
MAANKGKRLDYYEEEQEAGMLFPIPYQIAKFGVDVQVPGKKNGETEKNI